ncbi:MAG: serine hydrolase domain-containing protein, partial [Bacteroidota bacterium]
PGAKGVRNADYLSMTQPYGAGSLLSTVADLSTWYHAVAAGKVISKESLTKALTPTKLNNGETENYGYGWTLGDLKGSRQFAHGGGINGFLSASTFLPDEEVFVAVLSNCNCHDPSGAANRIATMAIGKYEPVVAVELEDELLEQYVGKYELMPNFYVVFTKNGKQLMAQPSGQGAAPLTATEKDVFVNEDIGIKVHFHTEGGKEASSFTLYQNGAELKAKRVE